MKSSGTHLFVVGLHDDAAALCPILLQGENQILKNGCAGRLFGAHQIILEGISRYKGAQYSDFSGGNTP